jgi:hypothetical protein
MTQRLEVETPRSAHMKLYVKTRALRIDGEPVRLSSYRIGTDGKHSVTVQAGDIQRERALTAASCNELVKLVQEVAQ